MFGWFFGQSISLRVGWSVGWISCGPAAQMPRSQLQSATCIHGRSPVVTVAARVLSAFQSICQLHPNARCQTPSTGSFRLPSTGGSFAGRVGWHRRHRPLSVASSPHRRRCHTDVVVATPPSESPHHNAPPGHEWAAHDCGDTLCRRSRAGSVASEGRCRRLWQQRGLQPLASCHVQQGRGGLCVDACRQSEGFTAVGRRKLGAGLKIKPFLYGDVM